jgi:hypothetical protein
LKLQNKKMAIPKLPIVLLAALNDTYAHYTGRACPGNELMSAGE